MVIFKQRLNTRNKEIAMKNTIRALRDPEYRNVEKVLIGHPAGLNELEDSALASITGGCAGVPGCTGGGGGPFATRLITSCTNDACP